MQAPLPSSPSRPSAATAALRTSVSTTPSSMPENSAWRCESLQNWPAWGWCKMSQRFVFEGVRVVDFSWVGVGPITAKYLADHGAEVIRIDSLARPDPSRQAPPWADATPGLNRSQFYANFNTSKYGVSLDLSKPRGRELAKRLVARADIVIESFTPRVMKTWGLDYPELVQIRPDLIMLSTCQQGQTGPHAQYPGYGNLMAALAGFYDISGWPDRPPSPPYGAYTDFIAQRFAAAALIAALDYRRRTGQGQYIDVSQFEAALQFLAPLILDYTVNGRVMTRRGNRDERMAWPQGWWPTAPSCIATPSCSTAGFSSSCPTARWGSSPMMVCSSPSLRRLAPCGGLLPAWGNIMSMSSKSCWDYRRR